MKSPKSEDLKKTKPEEHFKHFKHLYCVEYRQLSFGRISVN